MKKKLAPKLLVSVLCFVRSQWEGKMNINRSSLIRIVVTTLGLSLIIMAVAVAAHKWSANSSQDSITQKKDPRVTDTLPPVISSIKGIDVLSAFIDENGRANITVVNHTGKAITGLALSSGNYMFSDDNGLTQDNPKPLIPQSSSYTFQEPISNLRANYPIRVAAAFYDDGTEDGDAGSRKNIHDARDGEKEKRRLKSK